GKQQAHRIAVAGHQPLAVLVERDHGVVERLRHRHAAAQRWASAPSATSHLALGSTPVSSSRVESATPVHSAQDASPCSACTLAWMGSREKSGALLPPHSTKVMRDTIG